MLKFKKDSTDLDLLLKALKDEGKYKVQRAAIRVLSKIGDTQAIEPLIQAYEDSHISEVKIAIIEALGNLGAVDWLVKISKEDPFHQNAAASALDKIGYIEFKSLPQSFSPVKISKENLSHQDAVARELFGGIVFEKSLTDHNNSNFSLLNDSNFFSLLSRLKTLKGNQFAWQMIELKGRRYIEYSLWEAAIKVSEIILSGMIKSDIAADWLFCALTEYESDVRKAAGEALHKLADISKMDELIKDLEGSSVLEVRENIAKILGDIIDTSIMDLFIKALGSPTVDIQITMVQLLSPLMDRIPDVRIRATKPLIVALRSCFYDSNGRQHIMTALSKIGSDAVEPLIREVNESGIEFYTHCRDLVDQFVNSYGSEAQLKEWQIIKDIKEQEEIEYERKKEASEQSSEVQSEEDWCDHAPMDSSDLDYSDGH